MNRLLRILVVHSVRDLVRYKSFLLLVGLLIAVDRVLEIWVAVDRHALALPRWREVAGRAAGYAFTELPGAAWNALADWRTLLALALLFLLKEAISLWPSSDMRRMHRGERKGGGLLASLALLRWHQVAWDATAVAVLGAISAAWCGAWYALSRALWLRWPGDAWLVPPAIALAALAPVALAAMSYSSKLAVMVRGTFGGKLALYLRLFRDWGLFWRSWLLFSLRIAIEGTFVAVIPAGALLTIDNFWLRILVASAVAAPAYSYVKMASFKFFLEVYRPYPAVYEEFREYYDKFQL